MRDGADPEATLASIGIDPGWLSDDKRPVDLARYVALIERAAQDTGNDHFGLEFGRNFTPERLGLIGQLAICSSTLGAALDNLARYFRFHQHATETCFVVYGSTCRLEYRILDSNIVDRRQDAELTMGMFINVIRNGMGKQWSPLAVHCEHVRPCEWRRMEDSFDAPFHFSQRTNAIVLNRTILDRPMPGANAVRLARLQEELIDVGGRSRPVHLIDRVRSEIRGRLAEGEIRIEAAAEALDIPRWTLQRQLEQDGHSFSTLLDGVRRELASRYVAQPWLPATEIAFLLGYSELSAFTRAFRRWFGKSPNKWRRDMAARTA